MLTRFFYTIWIILFLFVVLFSPPLLPFNTIYVMSLIALVLLLLITEDFTVFTLPLDMLLLVLGFLVYVIVIILTNYMLDANSQLTANRMRVIYQVFFLMPMQFICAGYVVKSAKSRGIETGSLLRIIIYAGLVEIVFVILAFVSPDLREAFLNSIIERGGIERVYANDNVLEYRAFGWADTLLDTFGYGMGIFAGTCLLCKRIGKLRFLFMVLFLFATALNSRSGLAIFSIAVLIWIIQQFRERKLSSIGKIFLAAFSIVAIFVIAVETELVSVSTLSWITAGFESIWSAVTGETMTFRTGSMQNSMFSTRFWELPESMIGLLFGKGHSIFGTHEILGVSSDVGYINYIWICGLFGTVLLLYIIFKWFRAGILETGDPELKTVRLFTCIAFFLMFIKGNIITHTVGTFLTILLMSIRDDADVYFPGVSNNADGEQLRSRV